MYFNISQIQTIITLLVGLSTIYGFISKFFADRQKKKLDEILKVVTDGFVTKPEFELFKGHVYKRLGRLEVAVFMKSYPELAAELKEGT